MDIEQILAQIQALPPEQQAQAMQQFNQAQSQQPQGMGEMPPAPGMAPPQGQQPPQQPVDPKMGLPGQQMPGSEHTFKDFQGQGDVIADQQAQAKELRGTPTPEGTYTRNAGFVAANPLSHIASAVGKVKGHYDTRKALEAKQTLSDELGATRKKDREDEWKREQAKLKEEALAKELREEPVNYNPRMGA